MNIGISLGILGGRENEYWYFFRYSGKEGEMVNL